MRGNEKCWSVRVGYEDMLMGFSPFSKYPAQLSEIDVLNIKLTRKHRSEFDKNGFESEYDDLRKKIYFRLLNTSRWWHMQSEYSNVQNISMLILIKVTNGILNATAGVSSSNSIVCEKVVFRSFNKWVIRCYIYISGLNIVSYNCGLLQPMFAKGAFFCLIDC